MRCGCGNRYSTNNVNVCINVTKIDGGSQETAIQLALLKQKVGVLSGDLYNDVSGKLDAVAYDLYNLSAQLSPWLSSSFTYQEVIRLKNLAEEGNFNALTGCIQNYNAIQNAVYQITFKQFNDPEQEKIAPEITDETSFANVSAVISSIFTSEVYQMGSILDPELSGGGDYDRETEAYVKISGFILGSWINPIGETNQDINNEKMEYFGTNAIFFKHPDLEQEVSNFGESFMYLTRNQVKNIYNQRGKIMKICALKMKKPKGE